MQRVLTFIERRKVRAFSLIIISSILLSLNFVSISIFLMLNSQIEQVKNNYHPTIQFYQERLNSLDIIDSKNIMASDFLEKKDYLDIANSDGVISANLIIKAFFWGDYQTFSFNENEDRQQKHEIKGVTSSTFLYFENIECIEGRVFSTEELENTDKKIILSKEFAELNNLSVGDYVDFTSIIPVIKEKQLMRSDDINKSDISEIIINKKEITSYEIIGITQLKSIKNSSDISNNSSEKKEEIEKKMNDIFIPAAIIEMQNEQFQYYNPNVELINIYEETLMLKNMYHLEETTDKIDRISGNRKIFVNINSDGFNQIITLLEDYDQKVSSFTIAIFFITFFLIILMFLLVNISRKKEFYIFKILGEEKKETIKFISLEQTCILFISYIIATVLSNQIVETIFKWIISIDVDIVFFRIRNNDLLLLKNCSNFLFFSGVLLVVILTTSIYIIAEIKID